MAIKIEMLRCFATVVKHGSLSEAADALGRTPSAVSMMLKQFEDHIGAPLFETARKSRLTPVGDLIYEEARREVTHFENTVTAMIPSLPGMNNLVCNSPMISWKFCMDVSPRTSPE